MTNPLLQLSGLPPFTAIKPEHVEPAIDAILTDNRAAIETLLDSTHDYTWANLVAPMEDLQDRLDRAWSPVSHMNSVVNSPALRDAYNACLPKLSQYATELGQNARLCAAYRRIAEGAEYAKLDTAQRKAIDNALRDFRLSGVDLPDGLKARFMDIQQQLSTLTAKFEQNVLDATQAWTKQITDETQLAGVPVSALAMMRQTAQQKSQDGWLLTLEFPCYYALMSYCDNRGLREEMYQAYATRASDQGPHAGRFDNSAHMAEILKLRHELALLLGFKNYAERSLATKMAPGTADVMNFLHDLASRSLGMAQEELAELRAFARAQHGINTLEPWDITYISEKLRQHRYAISQEDIKPYFPEPRVVNGLFDVVQRLYGITINERHDVETWHKDVRVFDIRDRHGELRASFYLDLYARPNKRGGAWMADCITRRRRARISHHSPTAGADTLALAGRTPSSRLDEGSATPAPSSGPCAPPDRRLDALATDSGEKCGLATQIQLPVAFLTCNFTPPVGSDPALFTHNEVITLFHEFGHGLHHMLTRVDTLAVSGISGVPWDAVELPSQFLENWCWEREALALLARHYQTDAALPDALYQKMMAAKNFQAGMQMVRQLEFALFDFRIHAEYDPALGARVQEILDEVRAEVAVIKPPAYHRFQHGFTHIFAGGYAAGYYSYKWAEVLSSDAFSKFEETGIFNRQTGLEFLEAILEQGGARDPMDLFMEFRGRKPEIDALLRHSGITA